MSGCAYTSWLSGRQEGIALALDHLEEQGLIEFDDYAELEDD